MDISPLSITVEDGLDSVYDSNNLIDVTKLIYIGESISTKRLVDLIICSEETIRKLNYNYRQKDSVTDVLSYPFDDDDYLGEIYICYNRAFEQAKEYEFSLDQELKRLLVHGLIHLIGYDHILDDEREIMEAIELKYFNFTRD